MPGDKDSAFPVLSSNGRFVVFQSESTNLVSNQSVYIDIDQIFLRDVVRHTTTLVSQNNGVNGVAGNASAEEASIGGDGRYVAFASEASNLVPGDTNHFSDVFVRDTVNHTTTLISRANGANGVIENSAAGFPTMTADGRYVFFVSDSTNLAPGSIKSVANTFVRDASTDTTFFISRARPPDRAMVNMQAYVAISSGGRYIAFLSYTRNPDPLDIDFFSNIFVRDTKTHTTALISCTTGR